MKNGKKIAARVVVISLLIGLTAGLFLQYRDAIVILEVTVVSDHDDRFHFYSDHGDGQWTSDEWSRPLRAGVPTKLYMKFHKSGIKRFKWEPLRLAGEIRFEKVRFTDRIDHPLRPFPISRISPKKDITLESDPDHLPLIFRVPEGAKDPQIYVTDTREWKFSTRRDLWDLRLLWRSLRIALVSFLLILPIALTASRKTAEAPSTP